MAPSLLPAFRIVYPSGSHGSFLKLLLNTMSGIPINDVINYSVYDKVTYLAPVIFEADHQFKDSIDIMINVKRSSYLKYFAMCLNRTSDINLLIEDLGTNIFEKIKRHPILKSFASSLITISGQATGDVEPKYIREWLRLCFFANNGTTITQFISPSDVKAKYTVDFESFYNGSILENCCQIYKKFNLEIVDTSVAEALINRFSEKLMYRDIDLTIDQIMSAIDHCTKFNLSTTNLLQQAWIDNCLVDKYNINPLLKNDYFLDTQELRKAYNLS